MDWQIKKRLSAEIGLGYVQKGIDIEYVLYGTPFDLDGSYVKLSYQFNRDFRLDYISLPVALQYNLGKHNRFYVLAGIYNSFLVKFLIKESLVALNEERYNSSGVQISSSESRSWTTDAHANVFDSGILAGMGVNWPLTNRVIIGVDVRGALGLVSIPRNYEAYGFQGFSEASKNISFETGLNLQYILE